MVRLEKGGTHTPTLSYPFTHCAAYNTGPGSLGGEGKFHSLSSAEIKSAVNRIMERGVSSLTRDISAVLFLLAFDPLVVDS